MSPVLKTARKSAGILAGTVDVALAYASPAAAAAPVAFRFTAGNRAARHSDTVDVDPRLRR